MISANKSHFSKIENLEDPEVQDVISIYKSIYESIFQRPSKFRGSRGSKGSG